MTPIVNPWWFFVIGLADRIGTLTGIVAFFSFVGIAIVVGVKFYYIAVYIKDKNWTDEETRNIKKVMKPFTNWQVGLIIVFIISLLISTFMPSSNTILKMAIAQNVTYERLEGALEIGKDVHDVLKRDVVDILNTLIVSDTVIVKK